MATGDYIFGMGQNAGSRGQVTFLLSLLGSLRRGGVASQDAGARGSWGGDKHGEGRATRSLAGRYAQRIGGWRVDAWHAAAEPLSR